MKRTNQFLFCPGPVNVADSVKAAAITNEIGHREKEFSNLLKSINRKLLALFELKNPHIYTSAIITGSGTAANESILSSVVVDNQHILIITNGEFGERLYNISKLHNKNTHILSFKWGQEIDLKKVDSYIKDHHIDIIMMVHHETCTGMLNPIEKIGKMAQKNNILFIVDVVSSTGADKIDLEKCNVGFCSGTSAKAIGSMPGIAFVVGRKSEFEKLKNIPAKTTYLDLYKFYKYSTEHGQTPNTPAVQLFYAFEKAMDNILHEGVSARRIKMKNLALLIRQGMKNLKLKFLLNEKDMSSVLTTVHIPKNIEFNELKEKLAGKNIIVYNGKGVFANKVFQVGIIGNLYKQDILFFLESLKDVLDSFKTDRIITQKKNLVDFSAINKLLPRTSKNISSSLSHKQK